MEVSLESWHYADALPAQVALQHPFAIICAESSLAICSSCVMHFLDILKYVVSYTIVTENCIA